MNQKAIEKTELNKILSLVADFATLDGSKLKLMQTQPVSALTEVKKGLKITEECTKLLFDHGVSKVEYFPPFEDEIQRAQKGATLSCAELIKSANLLRATRIAYTSITAFAGEEITEMKRFADSLYFDKNLEDDITSKILSETEVSDSASDKLYSLRREIRLLNERIRARLSEYLSGDESKYLQESLVTMRDNRYVLPVRAEYKRNVKGFIHDKSATGATFFIEPEEVLEMNNELRSLQLDEKEEVQRILTALSNRVGQMASSLLTDINVLEDIDCAYARAQYSYKLRCIKPEINDKGIIDIQMGRHPLIDAKTVVPVSVALGSEYRFLLISGPNTGGKTVTLKMVGLFSLMAMVGLFVPAKRAVLSTFDEIYCDVGDAQSIEESLSTFSSHITNIIEIVNSVKQDCLVLMDELGGGTDPDEGQALAKAILSHLLASGCTGVVTTHYTSLKEFAYQAKGIENACMEFDADTLRPLYVMKIGLPGSSNALGISRRLGLKDSILQDAFNNLSKDAQRFENILQKAEESRIHAEEILIENEKLRAEWQEKLHEVEKETDRLKKEREKLLVTAKAESKRIVNERIAQAEELLLEMEQLFEKESLTEFDLIKARTLKNRLADTAYNTEEEGVSTSQYVQATLQNLKIGAKVWIQSTGGEGTVQNIRSEKKEAEILCGSIRLRCKISDLRLCLTQTQPPKKQAKKSEKVVVNKRLNPKPVPTLEINVIGCTVHEAIPQVEAFLDSAVLSNLDEVRIVHGMGTGKLRAGIHDYLRTQPTVAEFRLGHYGEGDTGVTIVKLK